MARKIAHVEKDIANNAILVITTQPGNFEKILKLSGQFTSW